MMEIITSIFAVTVVSAIAAIIGIMIGREFTMNRIYKAIYEEDQHIPRRYKVVLDRILEKL